MYVIPKKDYSIPDPGMKDYLPSEGREVVESEYWHRRIRDEDVAVGKAKPEKQVKE